LPWPWSPTTGRARRPSWPSHGRCGLPSRSASGSASPRSRHSGVSEVLLEAVFKPTRDLRVDSLRPLLPPAILLEELPLSEQASMTVSRGREEVASILNGHEDRLVVVVRPFPIHDPRAAPHHRPPPRPPAP